MSSYTGRAKTKRRASMVSEVKVGKRARFGSRPNGSERAGKLRPVRAELIVPRREPWRAFAEDFHAEGGKGDA
jgi:hypothetical protein